MVHPQSTWMTFLRRMEECGVSVGIYFGSVAPYVVASIGRPSSCDLFFGIWLGICCMGNLMDGCIPVPTANGSNLGNSSKGSIDRVTNRRWWAGYSIHESGPFGEVDLLQCGSSEHDSIIALLPHCWMVYNESVKRQNLFFTPDRMQGPTG